VGVAQLLESRGWSVGSARPVDPAPLAPSAAPPEPSSTAALRTPDQMVSESTPRAPDLVTVPAGEFAMGCRRSDDARCDRDELPHHKVRLSEFEIDRLEVDVARYAACVRAGRCSVEGVTEGELCNWSRSDRLDHPMNCVDWHQARAYCAWAGMRLPTEAEWERAARGKDRRIYPWGDEAPSCKLAVMDDGGDGCGRDSTWPTGSRPAGASPYGALDLAGNVWEWVADRYDPRYYEQSPRRDPLGPDGGVERSVRGGSWLSNDVADLRASERHGSPASYRSYNLGFRCARAKSGATAAAPSGSAAAGKPAKP
jgi:formylglycine-generating enzyme required for sulfatase activity